MLDLFSGRVNFYLSVIDKLTGIISETDDGLSQPVKDAATRLFDLEKQAVEIGLKLTKAAQSNGSGNIDASVIASIRHQLQNILSDLAHQGIQLEIPTLDGSFPSPDTPTISPAPATAMSAGPGAVRGADVLEIAKRHVGQPYRNINIDYADPNWKGAFDCAEFASYCVWRAYKILYGARYKSGVEPAPGALNVEAYTGYWKEDVFSKGKIITSDSAFKIPGAFVLRFPPGPGTMGHIAICLGDGKSTYEAADVKRGVIKGSLVMSNGQPRRWDTGVLIPGVDYGNGPVIVDLARIYRKQTPPVYNETVEQIQAKLAELGFLVQTGIDGEFGDDTETAVAAFQRARGLLVDGEVGPDTGAALGLGQIWDTVSPKPDPASPSNGVLSETPHSETPGGASGKKTVIKSTKFPTIKNEYQEMWNAAVVRPAWSGRAGAVADKLIAQKARYEKVSGKVGVTPWYVVGAIHNLEASLNFNAHLHNGDPLTARTVHEPPGRPIAPPANGQKYTWEESAIDALRIKDFHGATDWSLQRILFRLEGYNGFGPRMRAAPTAYLWSGTDMYERGKFVSDGVWDPNAVSQQVGCVAILKALIAKGAITI